MSEVETTLGLVEWRVSPRLTYSPILTASLESFYEHGYHGTSVRDIARRAGISIPAIYYHHPNKEDLLFSLLDSSIDHLNRMCDAAIDEAGADPVLQFLNLVECIVRYMSNSREIAYLDGELRSLSAELRDMYVRKRDRIERSLVSVLRDGLARGSFDVDSPKNMARALLGMLQAIATWYAPGGELSVDRMVLHYINIAVHAVTAAERADLDRLLVTGRERAHDGPPDAGPAVE